MSELNLLLSDLTDECVDVINRLVVRKLITLACSKLRSLILVLPIYVKLYSIQAVS